MLYFSQVGKIALKEVETLSIGGINITATLERAKKTLAEDQGISDSFKSLVELLLVIIGLLLERLGVNSQNSSKPPSQDPHKKRGAKRANKSGKKPGAQVGHPGNTLKMVDDPDEVVAIDINRRTIPNGTYTEAAPERRQVVDIIIEKFVTEYRSQTLINQQTGVRFCAPFPENIRAAVQYGPCIRGMATYMSLWQLLPYDRIRELFSDQTGIPLSPGTIFNINKEAYDRLEDFEQIAKQNLIDSTLVNADETGINVNGKNIWLHSASNEKWTLFSSHVKRGSEATDEIGILPFFRGTLVHDCWGPYFKYTCTHAICNAHILRELTAVWENDQHQWTGKAEALLRETNDLISAAGNPLSLVEIAKIKRKYDKIMRNGEKECPPTRSFASKKTRTSQKDQSKKLARTTDRA